MDLHGFFFGIILELTIYWWWWWCMWSSHGFLLLLSVWMDYMNVLILHLFWRLLLLLMHVGVPFKFCCWGRMMVSYCKFVCWDCIVDVCAKLDAKLNGKSQPIQPISILYKTLWSKTPSMLSLFCRKPFEAKPIQPMSILQKPISSKTHLTNVNFV